MPEETKMRLAVSQWWRHMLWGRCQVREEGNGKATLACVQYTPIKYFECFLDGAINLFLKICPLGGKFLLRHILPLKRTGERLNTEYETDGLC